MEAQHRHKMQTKSKLTEIICWTRMQAEAGQDLHRIIARKEKERVAGGGLFFWGVGNAPSRFTAEIARSEASVDVVFSTMKTRPKTQDAFAKQLIAWGSYIDHSGVERLIPPHVLVTSRASGPSGVKKVHYALMCHSVERLSLTEDEPFDHNSFVNLGGTGLPIGNSQVTVLAKRAALDRSPAAYQVNLRARLVGSYWVKLTSPTILPAKKNQLIDRLSESETFDTQEWLTQIREIRGEACCLAPKHMQLF
jgi:hypothetical protein